MARYRKPQTRRDALCQVASLVLVVVAVLNLFDVFDARFEITPMILFGIIAINLGQRKSSSKQPAQDEEPPTPVEGIGG